MTGQATMLEPLAEAAAAPRARRECTAVADGSAGCDDCGRDDRESRDGVETSIEAIQRLVREHGTVVASSVRAFTTDTGGVTASAVRGVTASGREPPQQPAFTRRILQAAQAASLHTALDTSGLHGERADDELLVRRL